jgi:hypothetical protein
LAGVGLFVGVLIGGGLGAGVVLNISDPTQSDQYRELQAELEEAQDRIGKAVEGEREARRAAAEARNETLALEADLGQREAEVAAREQAVAAAEQRIAANSIGVGFWTVGVDVEPGSYRTSEPVTRQCYWAIYRSGTNGSDIVDNAIVDGGFPTVQLSAGQDFENDGCPTFVKQ